METIELHARSLRSKWGFFDGDLLDEIIWASTSDQERDDFVAKHKRCLEHETLIALVTNHLIPKLDPTLEFVRFTTCHNPIRLADPMSDDLDEDVSVTVSREEVLATARVLIANGPRAIEGTVEFRSRRYASGS